MSSVVYYILIYLAVINMGGFLVTAIDKNKARRKMWRIPEKTILLTAFVGGSAGVYIAMLLFHHKTRHAKFSIGVPLILILQAAAAIYYLFFVM